MKISALLLGKGSTVATIQPDVRVGALVAELARLRIGALVVSSDGHRLEGIVSERDIVRHLEARREGLLGDSVESIMSSEVHTCSPDDDVESLMRIMTDHRVRHVPVLREGELCGLVSIGDLVKSRIGELEADRKALYDYIEAR